LILIYKVSEIIESSSSSSDNLPSSPTEPTIKSKTNRSEEEEPNQHSSLICLTDAEEQQEAPEKISKISTANTVLATPDTSVENLIAKTHSDNFLNITNREANCPASEGLLSVSTNDGYNLNAQINTHETVLNDSEQKQRMNAKINLYETLQNNENQPHLVGEQLEEETPLVLNTGNIVFSNQETPESKVPSFFDASSSSSTSSPAETSYNQVENILSAEVTSNDIAGSEESKKDLQDNTG